MNENPTKFHKSLGNVKDEEVSDGEIRLLQAVIHDCEETIIAFMIKEVKIQEKIKKILASIKEERTLAQESRMFIDEHPLFEAVCVASGITPLEGRKKFYSRVEAKFERKAIKRKKSHGTKKS